MTNAQRLILLIWFALEGFILYPLLARTRRKGRVNPSKDRVRRGTGHAMLGLREFIEPSVEYVLQAENTEQADDDDRDGLDGDVPALLADLSGSLRREPVDHEEVRRHLATARRMGIDWRELYERAVQAELTSRPYRAPALPPSWKVAPRE